MRYKTFLLFGAPGSGKGTQGMIMGQIPGFVHVSCGEIFRNLRVGSKIGKVFLEYSSRGDLVPDDVTIEMWSEYIDGLVRLQHFDPELDTLLLDGIPRNVEQAKLVDSAIDVKKVYYLDCHDKEVMYMRLKRRAIHENRLDDANDEVITNRLRVYEAETYPVLDYYPKEKVVTIDTGRTPVEVLADILADIKNSVALVDIETEKEQER